jgi:molybdopterin molybdotransferase
MVSEGADAVVMIEYTEMLTADELAVYRPVSVKQHLIGAGDDMKAGDTVLKAGKLLRAADLGVLISAGQPEVRVNRRPVVSVISTGDEIVPPDTEPGPGEVRDINSYTIAAAAEALGFEVPDRIVVRDDDAELKQALAESLEHSDIVLLSGGSSAGKKDYSLSAIASLGDPGIQCHGLAFKPGKPTIIANARGKAVIGLPGHPVSALLVFSILGEYLVRLINGAGQRVESWVEAVLTDNISGAPGRETWQMVRLEKTESGYAARPVYGESGLITLLAGAEGSVRIPRNREGISSGTAVRVYLIEK